MIQSILKNSRKGITPVIAVVLLITVTVGASSSIYSMYNAAQSSVQSSDPGIDLMASTISVESCWGDGDDPYLSVRNTGDTTFNSTSLEIRVENSVAVPGEDIIYSDELVDPDQTVTIDFMPDEPYDRTTTITIMSQQDTINYNCLQLD